MRRDKICSSCSGNGGSGEGQKCGSCNGSGSLRIKKQVSCSNKNLSDNLQF